MMTSLHFKQSVIAITIGLAAWFCYSLSDASAKLLSSHYTIPTILLAEGIISFVLGIVWLKWRYGLKSLITAGFKWHMLRGVLSALTAFFAVSALAHVPLAEYYSIVFLSPIVISLLSSWFLGDRLAAGRILAIIAGFVGVLIVAGPQFSTWNIGIFYNFMMVITLSANNLVVRKIGDKDPLPLYALFSSFCIIVLATILILPDAANLTPQSLITPYWPFLLMLGIFVMAANICVSLAFAKAPDASIVAPFHYSQLIWGALLGFFIFAEIPTMTTIIGAVIVTGSGLYILLSEYRKQKTPMG